MARLISELKKIDVTSMAEGVTRKSLENVQRKPADQDKLMEKLTATGLALGKDSVAGIKVSTKAMGRGANGRPWCQIVLSNELISSEVA